MVSIQEDEYERSTSAVVGTEKNAFVFPNCFQPFQCCCRLCCPGEYLRLGTLVRYNWAQVIEACDCLKLSSIYFDLFVDAAGVVCYQRGLLCADLRTVGCGGISRYIQMRKITFIWSPRGLTFRWWGCCFDINQLSLPTFSFLSLWPFHLYFIS